MPTVHRSSRLVRAHLVQNYPVIRWAIVAKLNPRPRLSDAQSFLALLEQEWPSASHDFRKVIAKAAQINESELDFCPKESLRLTFEGKTAVFDFPRLYTTADRVGSKDFDARITMTLCSKKDLSSKIWARVGSQSTGTGVERNLEGTVADFRRLARIGSEWAFRLFQRLVVANAKSKGKRAPRIARLAPLEVSVLANNDAALGRYLESLAISRVGPHQSQNLTRLGAFLKPLSGDNALRRRRKDSFLFSAPAITGDFADEPFDTRDVVFLMRPHQSRAQAIGVGFDNSAPGDMAVDTARTVSRWIARRL